MVTVIPSSTQIGLASTVSSMRCTSSILPNRPSALHTCDPPRTFIRTRNPSSFRGMKAFRSSSSTLPFPPFFQILPPISPGFFSLRRLPRMNASRRFISTSLHSTNLFIHSFRLLYCAFLPIHSRFSVSYSRSFRFRGDSLARSCSLKSPIRRFWSPHCFFTGRRSRRSLTEISYSAIAISYRHSSFLMIS